MKWLPSILPIVLVGAVVNGCESPEPTFSQASAAPVCSATEANELYEKAVGRILADPASQSCVLCHDDALNLNTWAGESVCNTMGCLVDRGVADLDSPENSRVLEFIMMAMPDGGTDLQVRREYDGYLSLIEYAAACYPDVCGDMVDPCGTGSEGTSGSGAGGSSGSGGGGSGCDPAAVQADFDATIFPLLFVPKASGPNGGACGGCHALPQEPDQEDAAVWLFKNDPVRSLEEMADTTSLTGVMFDLASPVDSEFITKPLPEGVAFQTQLGEIVGVAHGGGTKLCGQQNQACTDKLTTLVQFLSDYVDCPLY